MARRFRIGVGCLFAAASIHAQTIAGDPANPVASPGQTIAVSLSLQSAGPGPAAIQFDMQWDAPLNVQAAAGDLVRGGGKSLYANPLPGGGVRYLIAGLNQTALENGELLKLIVSSDPSAAEGGAQVRLSNIMAAAADATAVSPAASPITVQLQASTDALPFPPSAIFNGASWAAGPLSPGELFSILGGFGSGAGVTVNGVAAPILYAGANQINAIVPFGLDTSQPATVQITASDRTLAPVAAAVAPINPGVFTVAAAGFGPGAILNQDYSTNSATNPAAPGSVIMVYGTGFGGLISPAADGQPAAGASDTLLPVIATIGGAPAEVSYAGAAPGIVYGVTQINITVPTGLAGDPASPLALTIGGVTTPLGPTVAISGQQ